MKRKVIITLEAEDDVKMLDINIQVLPKVEGEIKNKNAAYWAAREMLGYLHSKGQIKRENIDEQ